MNIKEFSEEYIAETAKLCRQTLVNDIMPEFLLREKTVGDPDYDPALTYLSFDEKGEINGFIQGVIRERKDEKYGYIKLLCVAKDFRRKKIATALYEQVEEKFNDSGVAVIRLGESYPNYFSPGIDPFYTEGICFFIQKGFKKFNDTANLLVDLTGQNFETTRDENQLKAKNIFIKRAEQKDKQKTLEWVAQSFDGWIPEVAEAFNTEPVSLFISGKAGTVWAFAAYEVNNKGTGWFGPMGTDIAARGNGIGEVLLKKCLASMKNDGFTKAVIPWVGPIPFYMNTVNAKVNRVFWRYEKKLSENKGI